MVVSHHSNLMAQRQSELQNIEQNKECGPNVWDYSLIFSCHSIPRRALWHGTHILMMVGTISDTTDPQRIQFGNFYPYPGCIPSLLPQCAVHDSILKSIFRSGLTGQLSCSKYRDHKIHLNVLELTLKSDTI